MSLFNRGDKVMMNPESRWKQQGFNKDGTPFIGKVTELSHGFYKYAVEWEYKTHCKTYFYNDDDLLPMSYQTNTGALPLLFTTEYF